MKAKLKLRCPICTVHFTTTNRSQIYCNVSCRSVYDDIKRQVSKNKDKQYRILNEAMTYVFDDDKFYIKSMMNNKQIKP